MNIGVLGATGFLGTNLCNKLKENNIGYIRGSRKLKDNESVDAASLPSIIKWIVNNHINVIINLSANCGGIGLNNEFPFTLWYENTLISANILRSAQIFKIKIIMIGTVCSYAAKCPTPFKEQYLMQYGFPESTNRAYGVTKLNGLIGAQALNKESNVDVVNLIPVNMYGPYDNFNLQTSHVIPTIIKKLVDAKDNNLKYVEIWGDGSASREFLYVEDCCDAIIKSLSIDNTEFINLGTGIETKIKDLVNIINSFIKYNGEIKWMTDYPNGQAKRCLDISKAKEILQWSPKIDLKSGLFSTIKWYLETK